MNKWFRRAVGTVGVAGGMLLLGAGTAHADNAALTPGQLDDLFSPTGGPNNLGLSLDTPGTALWPNSAESSDPAISADLAERGGLENALLTGLVPDLLGGLPITSVLPTNGLGLPTTRGGSPAEASTETLPVTMQTPTIDELLAGETPLAGLFERGLPVQGNLNPGGGVPTIPLGTTPHEPTGTEAGDPLGMLPTTGGGSLLGNVLQGSPVPIGGLPMVNQLVGQYLPRHAASGNAAAPRHAAPNQAAASRHPADQDSPAPRHDSPAPRHAAVDQPVAGFAPAERPVERPVAEALPTPSGLPALGGLPTPTGLPLVGGLLTPSGLPLVGGLLGQAGSPAGLAG